jgi:hypothetical protein
MRVQILFIFFMGLIQACSANSPSVSQPVSKPSVAAAISSPKSAEPPPIERQTANLPEATNLPTYCAPDEYKTFFEQFVRGKDRQGNDTRATYTSDLIEIRDYNTPDQVLEVLRRQDDEFSIDLRDYRWVQLVPSSVDNSPYTRLKVDIYRASENTFRADYIKAQYKYTGDITGTESEEIVQTYGNPAAYIFQHRNGCWSLTQKLQVKQ